MSIGANEGAAREQIPGVYLPILFISPLHFRVCVEGHEILIIKSHSIARKTHGTLNRVLSPPKWPLHIRHFREIHFFKKK